MSIPTRGRVGPRDDGDAGPASVCFWPQSEDRAVAEQAGFDLQLSGHTHAGQFFRGRS